MINNGCFWGVIVGLAVILNPAYSETVSDENLIVASDDQGKITIDGFLNESSWQKAQVFHLEHSLSQEKPSVDTAFQFVCDGRTLYLGVRCEQPARTPVVVKCTRRDDEVWMDDCVGLSIDPWGQGKEYYRFLFTPKGTLWDARSFSGRNEDYTWNAEGVLIASQIGEGFWSVELAIPIYNFLVSESSELSINDINDTTWRFNVTREYKGGNPKYLTYFPAGNYFDTSIFGLLTGLSLDYPFYAWKIFQPELQNVQLEGKKYKVSFNVSIENFSTSFRAFELTVDVVSPDGNIKKLNLAPTFGADAKQSQTIPFSFEIDRSEVVHLRFCLRDKETNEIAAYQEYKRHIDTSPLELLITEPFYRSAIYATMDIKKIEVELSSRWPVQFDKMDRMHLLLMDGDGKTIVEKVISGQESFIGRHTLDIPKLAPGDYVCKTVVRGEGKLPSEAQAVLHVYSPSVSEVRVNKYLNFVVNGKEVFPIGFFADPGETPAAKYCNVVIAYRCAPDLKKDSAKKEAYAALAERKKYFLFPYTQGIWPHQDGAHHNEFAHKPLTPDHARMIADLVSSYQHQPDFFSWYLADEPSPQLFQPDYLNAVARTIRKADPYHPCYISFNFGYLAAPFDSAVDAVGIHWYVGFTDRGPANPMVSVVEHMKNTCKGVKNRKAVIFSPQIIIYTHQYDVDVRPVFHIESRCMAYLGIVNGAKGIIWYAARAVAAGLETRLGLPVLAEELRKLDYVFLAHDAVPVAVFEKDASKVYTMGKIVNGQLYIIAVSAADHPMKTVLTLPEKWSKLKTISELASKSKVQSCENGKLNVSFSPYQVRLFTTDPSAPKLTSMEELEACFKMERERLIAEDNYCYAGRGAKLEVSPNYGNWGTSRQVIDGYTGWATEIYSLPQKGSWCKVVFPEKKRISRIEVSSSDYKGYLPRLKEYDLDVFVNGKWQAVSGEVSEKWDDNIYTQIHAFTPVDDVEAIRLTMHGSSRTHGFANEIKAFSPEKK